MSPLSRAALLSWLLCLSSKLMLAGGFVVTVDPGKEYCLALHPVLKGE